MTFSVKTTWGKIDLILESGKLARQADGSVLVTFGKSMVLCTAVVASKIPDLQDFTDLTVHYQERYYAAGKIPSGFIKREGKPSDKEILISRIIDRSLRPIIKLRNTQSLQVICTVLSYDGENLTDIPSLIGAVAAVKLAGIDCITISGVRICTINDKLVINPKFQDIEISTAEMFISGTIEAATMIEFEAAESSSKQILKALKLVSSAIMVPIKAIDDLIKQAEIQTDVIEDVVNKELIALVKRIKKSKAYKNLVLAFECKTKKLRYKQIETYSAKITEQFGKNIESKLMYDAINVIKHDIVKNSIVVKRQRIDGRAFDEIRDITCEVNVLPKVHGSAIFTRGETQVLSVVTIGGKNEVQIEEDITSVKSRRFMLYYNFPSFSVGEASIMKGVSRREIGHGNLARKALSALVPFSDKTSIRVIAEVLECNGSSSMASICASSLALMDAGIQISKHVAGIAMGMIQHKNEIIILSDILGDEDHLGDMDFKLAGTLNGITAMQMDTKSSGILYSIFSKVLDQGIVGIKYIIAKMHKATVKARQEVNENVFNGVVKIKIEKDRIRTLIGPGGKTIKEIIAATRAKIDIEDDGTVTVNGSNSNYIDAAIEKINALVSPFRTGEMYDVTVLKVVEYGIFVKMPDNSEGFIHISDLADSYIDSVEKYISVGQQFTAKMIGFDRNSKVKLSLKTELSPSSIDVSTNEEVEVPKKDARKKRFF